MNKVLNYDDDRELCALIKQSILQECIEADCCYSGKSGCCNKKKRNTKLVILDVMMPGFDGFETLEQIDRKQSAYFNVHIKKNVQCSKCVVCGREPMII